MIMPGITSLEIKLDGVGNVLSSIKLAVPEYQRSYSWEKDHVGDLLRDIHGAFQNKEPEYFLGSVVLTTKNPNQLEVVDGQQRLATTSLFIAAVCAYLVKRSENERADLVSGRYLFKKDPKTLVAAPQLQLNAQDNTFFQGLIALKEPKPERESHKRLLRAFSGALAFVSEVADKSKDPVGYLMDFLEFWASVTKIIVARVPDDTNAWIIFETLNDRGLVLSTTDLLKNHLFGKASDQLPTVRQNWITMTALLDSGGEALVLMFLRHSWASYNGLTRERELFDKVKRKVASKESAVGFSSQLVENAKVYSAILNSHDEFWLKFGNSTRSSISTLKDLGFTQPRPLMLAVLANFQPKDCEKFLKVLVSCSIRFTVSGALGSSSLENFYSNQAAAIRDKKIESVDELIKILVRETPDDHVFRNAFETASVSSAPHARYYLRSLELIATGEKEPELLPNPDAEVVTLEHVLPKNPEGDSWRQFNEQDIESFSKRIGNLVLLKKGENNALGNVAFIEKKAAFDKSSYRLTKELCGYDDWTTETIVTRQKALADLAIKAWSL